MNGRVLACVFAALVASACNPGAAESALDVESPPLMLDLRDDRGRELALEDFRGRVVVIALIGTYDTASQASLDTLRRLAQRDPRVAIVGLLAQFGARDLAPAFAAAADVPFPIAYDPTTAVTDGTTGLGRIGGVPCFVVLDAEGVQAARHEGYVSDEDLDALVERARRRAPEAADVPPPLFGRPL